MTDISPSLLIAAVGCTPERAALFAPHIAETCERFDITTPGRLAMFLAQVSHESGAFRYTSELWGPTAAQLRYEGRADLGNTQPGDGARFRGHGLIQTTGRANHRELRPGLLLAGYDDVPDFEANPERLTEPRWAAASAGFFWSSRNLNALADAGRFDSISKAINLGNPNSTREPNGAADRRLRWSKALSAINLHAKANTPANATEVPAVADTPAETVESDSTRPQYMPAGEILPETPMATALIATLGSALIDVFAPLAKEKIQKEIGRHSDNPAVAEQISTSAVEMAKALTGRADPIEAVAEVKRDPALVQQVESNALADLEKMAPMLDRLAALDKQAWDAEESSRSAAAARAASEPWDMTKALVIGAFTVIGSLILFVGIIAGVQAYKGDIKPEVWAQIAGLIGFATGVGTTIYAYRFGTSRSSGAKDLVIAQMQHKGKA